MPSPGTVSPPHCPTRSSTVFLRPSPSPTRAHLIHTWLMSTWARNSSPASWPRGWIRLKSASESSSPACPPARAGHTWRRRFDSLPAGLSAWRLRCGRDPSQRSKPTSSCSRLSGTTRFRKNSPRCSSLALSLPAHQSGGKTRPRSSSVLLRPTSVSSRSRSARPGQPWLWQPSWAARPRWLPTPRTMPLTGSSIGSGASRNWEDRLRPPLPTEVLDDHGDHFATHDSRPRKARVELPQEKFTDVAIASAARLLPRRV